MQSKEGEKVVSFPHLSGFPQIYKGHFFWSTHVRLISSQNGYFKKSSSSTQNHPSPNPYSSSCSLLLSFFSGFLLFHSFSPRIESYFFILLLHP